MTLRQLDIDFTVPYNTPAESQSILDANRPHFSGQTLWVFEQLMAGRTVDGTVAHDERKIFDLRARIYTIKAKGFKVSFTPGPRGMKRWKMEREEREYNKNRYVELLRSKN